MKVKSIESDPFDLMIKVIQLFMLFNIASCVMVYSPIDGNLSRGKVVLNGKEISTSITLFEMESGGQSPLLITGAGKSSNVTGIGKVSDDELLVSFSGSRGVEESWIFAVDIKSGKANRLIEGRKPVFLHHHNKFLFVTNRDKNSNVFLCLADMDKHPIAVTKIYKVDYESYDKDYRPVQVSKDKVILPGSSGNVYQAQELDINTLELSSSPIGDCIPQVWFESRELLLCWKGDVKYGYFAGFRSQTSENPYFLTSVDGKAYKQWNDEHMVMYSSDFDRPLYYIPETDVLLIQRKRTSIGYGAALYAYDMKKKKQVWLLNGIISPSTINWISDRWRKGVGA